MASAGKNKKSKFKTVSLNEFLSDDAGGKPPAFVPATSSWADEMESQENEDDGENYGMAPKSKINRAALPTAPRAARGADVDMAKLPSKPPFTAFLGNLSYDADEEEIEKFFRGLKVVNIRLPQEGGRFKGFGYAEFEDQQTLIDALAMTESMLKGRKLRIDLAEQSGDGRDRDGGQGRRQDDGEDRTLGDWRRSDDRTPLEPRRDDRRDDRSGFGDRGDRGDRESRSDRGGAWGHDKAGDRGFGGGGGGGGGRFGDRDGGHDDSKRSFGSGYRDGGDRYGDRDRDRYQPPRDRDDRFGPPRGDRDRYQPPRDRDDRYGPPRDRYEPPRDRDGPPRGGDRDGDAPKERPRLKLQPRSKPKEEEGAAPAEKSSSIFGGAKPVDTAAREREIEERLNRLKDYEKREEERETVQETMRGSSSSERTRTRSRRDSADSDGGDTRGSTSRRERKLSSSSSGKGIRTVAPPPGVGSARVRRDTEDSHEEVFDEDKAPKTPPANTPPKKEKTEPPAKLVPAPPPKENIWEKRKMEVAKPAAPGDSPPKADTSNTGTPPKEPVKEPVKETAKEPAKEPVKETATEPVKEAERKPSVEKERRLSEDKPKSASPSQAPAENASSKGKPDLVPAEPPKENVWEKRKKEATKSPESGPPPPAGAWARGRGGHDASRGRGGPADRGHGDKGEGRGSEGHHKKERPLPTSVDEMPKLEESKAKDFSDTNKFAHLLAEDENDENDVSEE